MNVGVNAAHHVVLPWPDGYHLMSWIYPQILLGKFFHEGEFRLDRFIVQMGEVQVDIAPIWAIESPAFLYLSHLGPRQDVPWPELHLVGNVSFQEPFSIFVQ